MRRWPLAPALIAPLLVGPAALAQPAPPALAAPVEAGPLEASAPSRVVIATGSGASQRALDVSRRIAAELRLAGFAVSIESSPPAQAAAADRANGAFAWIVLTTGGDVDAEIWVRHPRSGAPSARRVDARDVEAASSQGALAIRAVETLRGTMFNLSREPSLAGALPPDVLAWAEASPEAAAEAAVAPPATKQAAPARRKSNGTYLLPAVDAPSEEPAAPPGGETKKAETDKPATPRRDRPHTWVGTGFGTLGSSAALGLSFGPRLTLLQELPYSFSVGASAMATFPAHAVLAEAHQFMALAEGVYTFGRKTWPVQPHVDLGAGVHAYDAAQLIAAGAFTPRGRQVGIAFALASGFGADFPIGSHVRIGADIGALIVLPEPLLQVGEGFTDGAKQPMFTGSLGVELAP